MANGHPNNLIGNDIATIREILMGDYIRQYAANFQNINEHFATDEADFNTKLDNLRNETNARIEALEKHFTERIDDLEKRMNHHVQEIQNKIEATNKSSSKKLSQLFNLLSSQLDDKD